MSKEQMLAIRTVMLPKDTNYLGSIFGGVILSYIDLSAAQQAMALGLLNDSTHKYVTKIVKEVNFLSPVYVGDAMSFYTNVTKVGQTSVMVKVDVYAEDFRNKDKKHVTIAEVLMVAVDALGRPVKLRTSSSFC